MGFEPTTLRDLVDALTTELLETPWRARVKCGSLTRTASRSHIVKSIQAHMTHNCITQSH